MDTDTDSSGPEDSRLPGAAPGEPDDPLYQPALQLARFYALLSPGLLQRELSIDRARAERLIGLLVERDVLGPVMIEHSGARESKVNMIFDGAGAVDLRPNVAATTARAGRLGVLVTALALLVGLGACVGLVISGLAARLVGILGLAVLSPAIADVVGLLVLPAAGGALVGYFLESVLSPDEDQIPYAALQTRRALWTLYALLALGFGSFQLFR
jgi:hypothetical protein